MFGYDSKRLAINFAVIIFVMAIGAIIAFGLNPISGSFSFTDGMGSLVELVGGTWSAIALLVILICLVGGFVFLRGSIKKDGQSKRRATFIPLAVIAAVVVAAIWGPALIEALRGLFNWGPVLALIIAGAATALVTPKQDSNPSS